MLKTEFKWSCMYKKNTKIPSGVFIAIDEMTPSVYEKVKELEKLLIEETEKEKGKFSIGRSK